MGETTTPTARQGSERPATPRFVELLIAELTSLRRSMLDLAAETTGELRELHPPRVRSAENLLHYVALRRHDIRELQEALESLGLSSLGRSESHVRHNIDSVLGLLARLSGRESASPDGDPPLTAADGRRLLREHAEALLGPKPRGRSVRIMVTMPETAARDPDLVRELVASGMDVCRINCAHDDPEVWERIVAHVRGAEKAVERPCRILMDVGGPKSRIGEIAPGPQVVSWHPRRDALGAVLRPARVLVAPEGTQTISPTGADVLLPAPRGLVSKVRTGDVVSFRDARGKRRELVVREVGETAPSRPRRGPPTSGRARRSGS